MFDRFIPRINWRNILALFFAFPILPIGAQTSEEKADALLKRMTLTEKIGQMVQINDFNGEIPEHVREAIRAGKIGSMLNEVEVETSLELQRLAREESRLGIPLIMARDVIHGFRTVFPIPLAQAASWEPDLIRKGAAVAAREAAQAGYHWTFAPMMDVTRDPRWGRIAEGFGEDPFLASQMAAAMVKGFQGDDLADPHTIAACAKHFVGYGAAEGGRDYDRAIIPDHMLRNVFLPPFRAAVDAGVATVMTSFNEINGIPASGHVKILREILKKEWGFEGFVVSDWESTKEMIAHGYCEDMRDVARKSARAGVDMEMQSSAYGDHLEALVRGGEIPEALIDDAARRILKIKFDLGLFENPSPYRIAPPRPPLAADLALARESALKSLVLLENSGILPLSPSLKSLAVIGPMADDPYEMLGTWNRDGLPEESITPLAGIRNLVGESVSIHYAPGLDFSRDKNRSGFEAAVAAAQSAEVVLFFAGEESILSGEAHSRAYLDLPGAQNELLEALAATGKPVVLIIMAGRPLVVGNLLDKTAALLYAWHPGTMGGPAIADVLFGKEAPSGKLTITFPKAEGQIPVYYAHKNTGRPPHSRKLTMMDDIPRRAYQSSLGDASRYLDIGYLPQYPFGYGLNYTRFEYGDLKLTSAVLKPGETLTVSATIRNSGKRDGAEIVQLYIRDLVGSLTRPVRELKGFQKINLKAGESRQVSFELRPAQLGFYNGDEQYVVEPGRFQVWIAPDAQSGLMGEFELLPGS